MLIYLDQNKWIDLARIDHKKDKRRESRSLFNRLKKNVQNKNIILPLSSIHYIETARISDAQRRARLGSTMWEFSGGRTLASSQKIVTHESEVALSNYFPKVTVKSFELIGFGVSHAFGEYFEHLFPNLVEMEFERSCITGHSELIGGSTPPFRRTKYGEIFKDHLKKLHSIKNELPRSQWMDALHAIVLADVITPFSKVMKQNNLAPENIGNLGKDKLSNLVNSMPSRAMDIHLSHQVLKKNDYNPKITDLEDWAGIGIGAQYCDVVICEKHFADMLSRDGFQSKAKILRNIIDLENIIPS